MAILFLLSIEGCIYIPTKYVTGTSRGAISDSSLQFIVEGVTSREEVLLALGEPDFSVYDRFTYAWNTIESYWYVYNPIAPFLRHSVNHVYTIEFDEKGHVMNKDFRKISDVEAIPSR